MIAEIAWWGNQFKLNRGIKLRRKGSMGISEQEMQGRDKEFLKKLTICRAFCKISRNTIMRRTWRICWGNAKGCAEGL